MSYSIDISPERRFILVRFRGEISIDEMREGLRTVRRAQHYDPSFDGLCDLRECVATYRRMEVEALARETEEASARPRGRWAVLVEEPVTAALTQLFAKLLEETIAIRIFSTVPAAAGWLGIELPPGTEGLSKFRPGRAAGGG